MALRQRLEAVEAYAEQVTQELNLVRAELAAVSERPSGEVVDPWAHLSLLPPVDLSLPADAYPQGGLSEPEDPPEYSAVVRQIELPETPPVWAGPPATWAGPAETPTADSGPVAEQAVGGEWSGLSLDIPLVAAVTGDATVVSAEFDEVSMAAARPAPLIDTVPTVTRRAS